MCFFMCSFILNLRHISKKKKKSMSVPDGASAAVLQASEEMPSGVPEVRGYDFNLGRDLDGLMDSFRFMGIQAMNIGKAVDEINRMRRWRLSDDPIVEGEEDGLKTLEARAKVKAKIFLAYTSNMVSCGNREVIKFLVQHRMVDVLVASAGGIEEDFMKCMSPHYVGGMALPGADLRKRGINRIGNMLVPNNNYCKFEDWLRPLLDTMLEEQREQGTKWTPSKMIRRMGKEINHPDSIYYWAYQNDIPVFCPAITDGSIGDMLFFQQYRNPGLIVDICEDIYRINNEALLAKKTGMIILGGGLVKHHTCNANLMRNGADFSVFINTGQEFDCSDSGARPDEAVSWGKIRLEAKPVKVYADASIAFPLIVSQTFAKDFSRSVSDIAKGLRVKQDFEAGTHDRLCAMEDARRAAEVVEAERVAMLKGECSLCTVTYYANRAHNLTRSP